MRIIPLAAVAAMLTAAMANGMTQSSASEPCPEAYAGTVSTDELVDGMSVVECDLVGLVATDGGASVQIPSPGMGVEATFEYQDHAEVLEVSVAENGTLAIEHEEGSSETFDPDAVPDPGSGGTGGPCNQNGKNVQAPYDEGHYKWKLGDGPRPAGLSDSQTVTALEDAFNNITRVYTDCAGLGDNVSAVQEYTGSTHVEADMHLNSNGEHVCGDGSSGVIDSVDSVDFGNLHTGEGPLAGTCRFKIDGEVIQVDVRFNTADWTWTNAGGAGCVGQVIDLRNVATHEAGHVFGLGHVNPDTDPDLTMRKGTNYCQIKHRTLGLGDVLGLEQLY